MEGREVSDSEEEGSEEEEDYGAQDAAVRAAQLDGATVEHLPSCKAAGTCMHVLVINVLGQANESPGLILSCACQIITDDCSIDLGWQVQCKVC